MLQKCLTTTKSAPADRSSPRRGHPQDTNSPRTQCGSASICRPRTPPCTRRNASRRSSRQGQSECRNGRRFHQKSKQKSTRLNSSHVSISYAVFCLKKKVEALDAEI